MRLPAVVVTPALHCCKIPLLSSTQCPTVSPACNGHGLPVPPTTPFRASSGSADSVSLFDEASGSRADTRFSGSQGGGAGAVRRGPQHSSVLPLLVKEWGNAVSPCAQGEGVPFPPTTPSRSSSESADSASVFGEANGSRDMRRPHTAGKYVMMTAASCYRVIGGAATSPRCPLPDAGRPRACFRTAPTARERDP